MKNIAVTENHLYNKAYAKGQKFFGRLVRVYVLRDLKAKKVMLANPEKEYINRLGISVSKKNGGAVTRNRIKRIIREGYRAIEREDCLKTGFLVIIAAKNPDVSELEYEACDLLYHLMVVMVERGLTWENLTSELDKRR